jgi:hypothetical protein
MKSTENQTLHSVNARHCDQNFLDIFNLKFEDSDTMQAQPVTKTQDTVTPCTQPHPVIVKKDHNYIAFDGYDKIQVTSMELETTKCIVFVLDEPSNEPIDLEKIAIHLQPECACKSSFTSIRDSSSKTSLRNRQAKTPNKIKTSSIYS